MEKEERNSAGSAPTSQGKLLQGWPWTCPHDTLPWLPHSPGWQVPHLGIGLQCGWEVTDLFPFYSPTQGSREQAPDAATLPCPGTVCWGRLS